MRGSGTPVCDGTNARAKKGPEYGETIGALQGGEDSAAAPEARQQIRMHRSRCMSGDTLSGQHHCPVDAGDNDGGGKRHPLRKHHFLPLCVAAPVLRPLAS